MKRHKISKWRELDVQIRCTFACAGRRLGLHLVGGIDLAGWSGLETLASHGTLLAEGVGLIACKIIYSVKFQKTNPRNLLLDCIGLLAGGALSSRPAPLRAPRWQTPKVGGQLGKQVAFGFL